MQQQRRKRTWSPRQPQVASAGPVSPEQVRETVEERIDDDATAYRVMDDAQYGEAWQIEQDGYELTAVAEPTADETDVDRATYLVAVPVDDPEQPLPQPIQDVLDRYDPADDWQDTTYVSSVAGRTAPRHSQHYTPERRGDVHIYEITDGVDAINDKTPGDSLYRKIAESVQKNSDGGGFSTRDGDVPVNGDAFDRLPQTVRGRVTDDGVERSVFVAKYREPDGGDRADYLVAKGDGVDTFADIAAFSPLFAPFEPYHEEQDLEEMDNWVNMAVTLEDRGFTVTPRYLEESVAERLEQRE